MTISDSTMSSKTSYSMLLFPFYQINMRRIYMKKQKFYYATGRIDYNMTNDYMFRVILQENKTALKVLLCALLRLKPEQIRTVTIENPIKLGECIDTKDFYLDINVLMNNNTSINLEMQVINKLNWTDRSLSYICRNYVDIGKGSDYSETKAVIHIGFLNYTLFKDYPEFYATYKLMNIKNHNIYNDKFTIGVVDLNRIDLATDEDKEYSLDDWVRLFKAKTWEELKMIAENKPEFLEASETLYEYNADLQVRQRCIARQEYLWDMKRLEKLEGLEEKTALLESRAAELENKNEQLENKNEQLENKNEQLENKNEQLENKNEQLENKNEQLENKNEQLENENERLRKILEENGIIL